jgi:hypothetical protein
VLFPPISATIINANTAVRSVSIAIQKKENALTTIAQCAKVAATAVRIVVPPVIRQANAINVGGVWRK